MNIIKKQTGKESLRTLAAKGVLFSVPPIVSFYLMEFYDRNPFAQIRPQAHFFNILIYESIAWLLFLLIGRARWALRITALLAMGMGLTNHYVNLFRGNPFVPWDIFSVKTAASVADNYDFTPDGRLILITALFLLLMALIHFLPWRIEKKYLPRILVFAGIACALVLFVHRLWDDSFQTRHRLYPFLFTPGVMVKYNGYAVTFAMDLEYMTVEKPEGYSEEEAAGLLESYDGEAEDSGSAAGTDESQEDLPNIIVIMDEAFSDLSVLGDFETSEDYMPFIHSLESGAENTITGELHVSVCGGNTADTEFEFLTGNTMAFLPAGSIPYQQYIRSSTPSLASYLQSLGYSTYAQHPYYGSGWNRETVYPLLGFEHLDFIDSYQNRKLIRSYTSDESDFEKIIETYENKEEGKPAFIFNVTMQNHGGYTDSYPELESGVTADQLGNTALNQYLSLIRITDSDLEELVSYFENADEKTILVFFGDHQPNDTVAKSVFAANGIDVNNLTDDQLQSRYIVPYVIWANYDIEESTGADTSVNYLAAQVLEAAGVPQSAYGNFLLELKQEYPVLSAVTETASEDTEELLNYRKLEYYQLFDWKEEE